MAESVAEKAAGAIDAGASLQDVDILTKGMLDIQDLPAEGFETAPEGDDGVTGYAPAESDDLESYFSTVAEDGDLEDYFSSAAEEPVPEAGLEAYFEDAANPPEGDAPSKWEQFQYSFEAMPTDIENAEIWLQANYPRATAWGLVGADGSGYGFDFRSGDDLYGEGFMAMDPEQRRERILEVRSESLAERYKSVVEADEESLSTTAQLAGTFLGAMSTPTVLIPFGGGLKAAAAGGAALGGIDALLYDVAQHGEVDANHVLLGMGIGGIGAPALMVAGRGVAAGSRKVADKISNKPQRQALEAVYKFEDELAKGVVAGDDPFKAIQRAMDTMGLTEDQLGALVRQSGHKPKVPGKVAAADIVEQLGDGGIRNRASVPTAVDELLGSVSTRIAKISAPVAQALRRLDFNVSSKTHNALERTHTFLDSMGKLASDEYAIVAKALNNGEFDVVRSVMGSRMGQKALDDFDSTIKVLDEYKDAIKASGYDVKELDNYWPRVVKDKRGMMKEMGRETASELDAAIRTAARKSGRALTELEESEIINKFLRGYTPRESKPGFVKSRKVTKVGDRFMKFYETPEKALHLYIRRMTNDLEKRAFFGRMGVKHRLADSDDMLEQKERIIQDSIGALVEKEGARMSGDDREILRSLLEARFTYGERSPNKFIQGTKNILYATTLGNPVSAAVQLGDAFLAAYANGFKPTMQALFGRKEIDMSDLGLADVAQELVSDLGWTAKFLDKSLKLGGFHAMDKFGKNTLLNGALKKARTQAGSESGRQELAKQWRGVLGGEYDKFVDDLANGRMSENIKLMLWNKLADMQPISLSEMPATYLRNPNGRIAYMLKTFTLKQMDVVRRDVVREFKQGNEATAVKNLLAYTMMFQMGGMASQEVKDWMLGRDTDISDVALANFWAMTGISKFTADKVAEGGKVSEAITNTVVPPLRMLDDSKDFLGSTIGEAIFPSDDPLASGDADLDVVKHIPVIGKLIHNFFLGGLEEFEERQDSKEMKELLKL